MYRGTFGREKAPCRRSKDGSTMANAPSGDAGGGIALRFGAKNAQSRWDRAFFTRRSMRGIFPAAHVAGKNDLNLSASGGNQEGTPVPSWTFPRTLDRGRRSPPNCLLLTPRPAIRLAAKRHCRRRAATAAGRGTGAIAPLRARAPSQLPPSIGGTSSRKTKAPLCKGSWHGQRPCLRDCPKLPDTPGMISASISVHSLRPLTQALRCAPLAGGPELSPSLRRGR